MAGSYGKATEILSKSTSVTPACYRNLYRISAGDFATDPSPTEILPKTYRNPLQSGLPKPKITGTILILVPTRVAHPLADSGRALRGKSAALQGLEARPLWWEYFAAVPAESKTWRHLRRALSTSVALSRFYLYPVLPLKDEGRSVSSPERQRGVNGDRAWSYSIQGL
jgi:hypothetical protein